MKKIIAILAAGTAAGVSILLAEYLFGYLVCRKQTKLPEVLSRQIKGNESEQNEQDDFAKRALNAVAMEQLTMPSADGLSLKASLWRAQIPTDKIIICVHGCRSSGRKEFCFAAQDYHRIGFHVLLIDQRACGESEGEYMTYGHREAQDVAAWIVRMRILFGKECKLWLHGISMGAATSLLLCDSPYLQGIIADCSYTSAWDEFAEQMKVSYHLPAFPLLHLTDWICRKKAGYSFRMANPLWKVEKATVPILFIHGLEDRYVPVHMALSLYRAASSKKELFLVEGAAHACSYRVNASGYLEQVLEFMSQESGAF